MYFLYISAKPSRDSHEQMQVPAQGVLPSTHRGGTFGNGARWTCYRAVPTLATNTLLVPISSVVEGAGHGNRGGDCHEILHSQIKGVCSCVGEKERGSYSPFTQLAESRVQVTLRYNRRDQLKVYT